MAELAAAVERRKANDSKQSAKQAVEKAKPGATISLGFFGFGNQSIDESPNEKPKVPAKKVASAPRGVPAISNWRQNRDGSISGVIFGSKTFGEGESITTSPITSEPAEGVVAQTTSGSR